MATKEKNQCEALSDFPSLCEIVRESLERRGISNLPEELNRIVSTDELVCGKLAEYLVHHIETHGFDSSESSKLEGFVDWLIHTYCEATSNN